MKTTPLLSILIPTKNRQEYALKVITHILKIKDNRFQLIVYDNSETGILETHVSDFKKDDRFKYVYKPGVLSFVDNFSLGINECEGEYLTIIGDDDGINPAIINITEWASNHNIEAVTPSLQLVYNWPGSGVNAENGTGRLSISNFTCTARFSSPRKEVINLLKNGCQNYLSFGLVKAYHGIVKKTTLDAIKEKTGHFIAGLSPDIYISVAASLLIKRVLIIDYPLTISGICKNSGSADSATGKHVGKLEQAPHLRGHASYEWSKNVPSFYSVETIWADSAIAAINDLKQSALLKYYCLDVISAFCIKLHPEFYATVVENMMNTYKISRNSVSLKLHLLNGLLKGPHLKYIKAVKRHFFNKNENLVLTDIPDIEMASLEIEKIIQNKSQLVFKNIRQLI